MHRQKIIAAVIITAFLFIWLVININKDSSHTSTPDDIVTYVQEKISSEVLNGHGTGISEIFFIPDQAPQKQVISGTVCGIMVRKSHHSAYIPHRRFITAVTLNSQGWGFGMNQPVIENDNETMLMDRLWERHCIRS